MRPHEIFGKIHELKLNDDKKGFEQLLSKLTKKELLDLHFATKQITNFCNDELMK